MSQFTTLLFKEQPRIAKAVNALTDRLPVHVRPAAAYALSTGGKRLRPMLALLSARALGYAGKAIYDLGATLEMFHVATLLHDDILDNADVRRSHRATHIEFGVPRTLLTADAMVARCFQTLSETGDPRFVRCLTHAVIGTADGEIEEIELAGKTTGGLDAYLSIIRGKTARLLCASCELGALCADADTSVVKAVGDYGLNLGMAFQIADDVLDFAPSTVTGKPSGGDIHEGKFTPPIAFYLESLSMTDREDFLRRFATHDFPDTELERVAEAIIVNGFADKAKDLSNAYLEKARIALDTLPPVTDALSETARSALAEALIFVRDRTA